VLTSTQIAAFIGVGLAAVAYVPQIWHLVRAHCSAGISRFAFCVWLGASVLVTTHALATEARVFVVLGGVQIVATTVILVYATKYASSACGTHRPDSPSGIGNETEGHWRDPQGIGGSVSGIRQVAEAREAHPANEA
jgi:PQ loop repeat